MTIFGMSMNSTESLLNAMKKDSCISFYLTGSRLFGTSIHTSDWDFFVADSIPLREFLEQHSFQKNPNGDTLEYSDGVTKEIYFRDNIHIQIVQDLQLKLDMQTILYQSRLLSQRIPKESSKFLWKLAKTVLTNPEIHDIAWKHLIERRM